MLWAFGGFLLFVFILGRVFYNMTYPSYGYERDFSIINHDTLTIIEVKQHGKNLSRGREVVTYQPRSNTTA